MAKMTLLSMVQDILNDLDGDEVNSINDSVEALQVAQIVKTTFFNIVDGKDYPHKFRLLQLEALGSIARPNYMKIPDAIEQIEWVKYNKRKSTDTYDKLSELVYKTPAEFMAILDVRISSNSNIQVITDFSGISLNIRNDIAPTYYTSFDDVYIITDAYDSGVDSSLQASKSSCYGKEELVFTLLDSFIPNLPTQMFSYLLNEAKSTAFVVLKQTNNPKAEQHSVTQRRRMSQDAWKVHNGITYPDYGRKHRSGFRNPDMPPRNTK